MPGCALTLLLSIVHVFKLRMIILSHLYINWSCCRCLSSLQKFKLAGAGDFGSLQGSIILDTC